MAGRKRWLAVAAVLVGLVAGSGGAQAYWRGGVWFGFGGPVYPGPVYPAPVYPAPVYPAPVYPYPYAYAPPANYPPPAARGGCYAGPYVCPLQGPALAGAPCACPTGRGPAWGQAR